MDLDSQNPSISDRIAQERQLTRFFSKLFDEALQLEADTVEFSNSEAQLKAVFNKGGDVLKTITLDSTWLTTINLWVKQRELAIGIDSDNRYAVAKAGNRALRFTIGHSLKNKTALSINQISIISAIALREAYQPLSNFDTQQKPIWESTNGLIVLAAPNQDSLNAGIGLSQFQSNAVVIGELAQVASQADIYEACKSELLIATVQANDAIEVLIKLKELSIDLGRLNFAGIICQGYVAKVCQVCAKEAVIDPKAIVALPEHIQPARGSVYKVGRGCPLCDDRGYSGSLAVYNAIQNGPILQSLVAQNKLQDLEVLKAFRAHGLISLLEDGVKKAVSGLTTLEALFKLTRVMPDSYLKLAQQTMPPSTVGRDGNQSLFAKGSAAQPSLLVVEDDPDQREILAMVFKSSGYDVTAVEDGVSAFECLETLMPDLVVSDLMMPRMDGREFVNKLKANPKFSKLPVLMLTVLDDEEREYDLLNIGADDYCPKTIQRKLLLKRVEKLIKRSRRG